MFKHRIVSLGMKICVKGGFFEWDHNTDVYKSQQNVKSLFMLLSGCVWGFWW